MKMMNGWNVILAAGVFLVGFITTTEGSTIKGEEILLDKDFIQSHVEHGVFELNSEVSVTLGKIDMPEIVLNITAQKIKIHEKVSVKELSFKVTESFLNSDFLTTIDGNMNIDAAENILNCGVLSSAKNMILSANNIFCTGAIDCSALCETKVKQDSFYVGSYMYAKNMRIGSKSLFMFPFRSFEKD